MNWETVIGLEVHVQLATRTKIFCRCPTTFGEEPNTNVCPVCLGLPGALPVTNRDAVRLAVRAALALGFRVHSESVFARKHYFYPDLPKGYQISQFDRPLATHGRLHVDSPERGAVAVGISRLHLEEDAGKSLHDRIPGMTAVDFNRAGVPLVEIVTEPDVRSPPEARAFLSTLKQVLEYLGVSDCNMEEGHLRVDANLSVRPVGEASLGVKQELKNMNSFAAVERALEQLRVAQIGQLERGGRVELATFSAATGELRRMRTKEESDDYRYFPEPDLPPLQLSDSWIHAEAEALPELPAARRQRLVAQYGIRDYDAYVLAGTRALADFYETAVSAGADPTTVAHWVMGPVLQDVKEHGTFRVGAQRLAELIELVAGGTVSAQAAKRVFAALAEADEDPRAVATRLGLLQVGDETPIRGWIEAALSRHPDAANRLRAGESRLFGFFIGEVMKESRGTADPKRVQALLREAMR